MYVFSFPTKRRRANITNINYFSCDHFYSGIGVNKVLRFGIPAVLGFLVVFVIALMAGWLPSYLTARFSTLTDPFQFESGTGYHISNSLLAIGNGGVFGKD